MYKSFTTCNWQLA